MLTWLSDLSCRRQTGSGLTPHPTRLILLHTSLITLQEASESLSTMDRPQPIFNSDHDTMPIRSHAIADQTVNTSPSDVSTKQDHNIPQHTSLNEATAAAAEEDEGTATITPTRKLSTYPLPPSSPPKPPSPSHTTTPTPTPTPAAPSSSSSSSPSPFASSPIYHARTAPSPTNLNLNLWPDFDETFDSISVRLSQAPSSSPVRTRTRTRTPEMMDVYSTWTPPESPRRSYARCVADAYREATVAGADDVGSGMWNSEGGRRSTSGERDSNGNGDSNSNSNAGRTPAMDIVHHDRYMARLRQWFSLSLSRSKWGKHRQDGKDAKLDTNVPITKRWLGDTISRMGSTLRRRR